MKLLELKGRDRDKLIAIKRNMQSDVDCAMFSVPHWSTDRNDAWELWDELPDPKSYKEVKVNGEIKHIISVKGLVYQGDSFADCASRAWLTEYYNHKVKK